MTETLGQVLRAAREARGETLDDVERTTHIRARQLSALEADNYAAIPSPAQARGYVKNYAQHLQLDLQDILGQYEAEQKKPAHILAVRPSASSRAAAAEEADRPRPARPPSTAAAARPARGGSSPGRPRAAPANKAGAIKVRRPRLLSKDLLVAAIVTVVLVGLLLWGGKQLASSVATPPTATEDFVTGLTTAQPLPTASLAPETTATPNLPTPAASYTGVNLSIRAEERSWVGVKVDGAEVYAGLMAPGETREFVGQAVVEVVTGNGLGTRVIWNGVDQGVMGELGQVVVRLWTLQGEVVPTPSNTPTAIAAP
ncbi:MAG: helix-turn-helix domain-containing protein [Anaerolineales bacterium]